MKNLIVAIVATGLLCFTFNSDASSNYFEEKQLDTCHLGGGIIDVVSTLTDVEITLMPDKEGKTLLVIFNGLGKKVAQEILYVSDSAVLAYPIEQFPSGTYQVVVVFPTGTEISNFRT